MFSGSLLPISTAVSSVMFVYLVVTYIDPAVFIEDKVFRKELSKFMIHFASGVKNSDWAYDVFLELRAVIEKEHLEIQSYLVEAKRVSASDPNKAYECLRMAQSLTESTEGRLQELNRSLKGAHETKKAQGTQMARILERMQEKMREEISQTKKVVDLSVSVTHPYYHYGMVGLKIIG